MKRTSPLWGSISILIGVVIAILSLLRGIWATVALIAVFAVWGLWLIFTQLLPAWRSNRTYRRRVRQSRDRQEAASDTSDSGMGLVLLRHVNHRISEHLRSVYPQAHWEWTLADPTRFIAYGGTGRIRVYGIPDYDYADVTLDRQGGLRCSLVKVAPLEDKAAPNQQPVDGGEEIKKDSFAAFPEKVYWPRLAKVLEQEGLTADVQDTRILISW